MLFFLFLGSGDCLVKFFIVLLSFVFMGLGNLIILMVVVV